MLLCMLTTLLMIHPVESISPDDFGKIAIRGCENQYEITQLWIKNHIFYIETKKEIIRIPLPPVREYTEIWLKFNLHEDRVTIGDWGRIFVSRGPKELI